MFKFLKDKLKSAISKISEGIEKEGKAEEKEVEVQVPTKPESETKGFFARIKEKITGKEEVKEDVPEKNLVIQEKKIEVKQEIWEKPKLDFKKEIKQVEVKKKHEESKEKPAIHHKKDEIKHTLKKEETQIKKHEAEHKKIPEKEEVKAEEIQNIKEISKKFEEAKTAAEQPEKKGFFAVLKEKIITTKIDEGQFEKLFWELELALMENNVAVEVIDKIKNDLKEELMEKPIKRTKVEETISLSLKNSIEGLFQNNNIDLIQQIRDKKDKPYIIAFFGINGSGKTTSIAKLASMLKENKISCVFAASDTFRAASIEQLQLHADKLDIKMIKHDYGSDPAAVAFDAIKHAKAKNIDAVLIDTAGRMHSNQNLIDEMKKIIRVAKPDLKIFVGESITGNDCVEQAKTFNDSVGIDGIILAKADVDEKGGAAVSVSYVTKKPILFLGTGQNYGDLEKFDSEIIMKNLGFAQ